MACLIEELVTEILLRLPVKSLLRCLCVCKGWQSLIKSPRFVTLHLNHPSNNTSIGDYMIFSHYEQESALYYCSLGNNSSTLLPMPTPDFKYPVDDLTVCGPCNGIFCVVVKYLYDSREEAIFLCNPATRESRKLPNHHVKDPPSWEYSCRGTVACGLGFDPCTNEYKVFSVLRYEAKEDLEVDDENDSVEDEKDSIVDRTGIYHLSSDSWREVSNCNSMYRWSGIGLLFNGRLYWKLDRYAYDAPVIILWFDIADEVTGYVLSSPLDDVPENTHVDSADVVVLEDCLAMAAVVLQGHKYDYALHRETEPCLIIIWTMINESWVKRFSISIPYITDSLKPITCWKNDVLLLLVMGGDDLISVGLVKEDGYPMMRRKVRNCTYGAIIMSRESLVSLR